MSNMSVSYCGSEIPLSEALDECFLELQAHLNHLHSYTRTLAMMPDQDNDYEIELRQVLVINDTIDDISCLFTELKSVVKQVIGKPPPEIKEAMKMIVETHTAERKRVKEIESKRRRKQDKMKQRARQKEEEKAEAQEI